MRARTNAHFCAEKATKMSFGDRAGTIFGILIFVNNLDQGVRPGVCRMQMIMRWGVV